MKIGTIKAKNHLLDDKNEINKWCKAYIRSYGSSFPMSYEITNSNHVVITGKAYVELDNKSTSSIIPVIFDKADDSSFYVRNKWLTNLHGLPEEIGELNLPLNHMTTLSTVPKIINGKLVLSHSHVNSFEVVPHKVFGDINVDGLKIEHDLKGICLIEGVNTINGKQKWVPIINKWCGPGKSMPNHIYEIGAELMEAGFGDIL